MKATFLALIGATLLLPAFSASAAKDEIQWQQHWKFVEAKRKQQAQGTAVAGRPAQEIATKEGKPACRGIGRSHPKGAYNC